MNRNNKILAIDNDDQTLDFVKSALEKEGFEVLITSSSEQGIKIAKQEVPNLILLEILMSEMDGIETCMELREISSLYKSIIVFHTIRNEDYLQIAAFNAGADDYIIKPVKAKILTTRIRALLKRHESVLNQGAQAYSGEIRIDREKYTVFKSNKKITLPRKEFELLSLLYSSPRKVFSRREIATKIWGHEISTGNRTIDVHIRKLREKLGEDYIKTTKGIGYSIGK